MKMVKNEESICFRKAKIKKECQQEYGYCSKEIIIEIDQSFYRTHVQFFNTKLLAEYHLKVKRRSCLCHAA